MKKYCKIIQGLPEARSLKHILLRYGTTQSNICFQQPSLAILCFKLGQLCLHFISFLLLIIAPWHLLEFLGVSSNWTSRSKKCRNVKEMKNIISVRIPPLFDIWPSPLLTRDSMRSYLISPTWAPTNILNDHNLSQYGLYSRT